MMMSMVMVKEKVLSRVLDILTLGRPDMGEFSNRLRLQKIVYLLQSSGVSLGFGFSWYVKGPYSPELTKALYEIYQNDTIFEESKNIKFKDHDTIVAKLKKFNDALGEERDNITYLEILASLHYINKVVFSGNGNLDALKIRLLEAKPSLETNPNFEALVEKAYGNLSKFT
jgi:uncharacterized protein YwgA